MNSSNSDSDNPNAGNRPHDDNNETTKQKVGEDARDAMHEAGTKAREKAETGKDRVAKEADTLSDAIDAAASKLDDSDREGLARSVRELSGHLTNAAGHLEGRSVDELANDAKRLARNNPALFVLGSIAVGFGFSRFFKASAEHDHDDNNTDQTDASRSEDTVKDYDTSTGTPMQDMKATNTTSTAPHNDEGRGIL